MAPMAKEWPVQAATTGTGDLKMRMANSPPARMRSATWSCVSECPLSASPPYELCAAHTSEAGVLCWPTNLVAAHHHAQVESRGEALAISSEHNRFRVADLVEGNVQLINHGKRKRIHLGVVHCDQRDVIPSLKRYRRLRSSMKPADCPAHAPCTVVKHGESGKTLVEGVLLGFVPAPVWCAYLGCKPRHCRQRARPHATSAEKRGILLGYPTSVFLRRLRISTCPVCYPTCEVNEAQQGLR